MRKCCTSKRAKVFSHVFVFFFSISWSLYRRNFATGGHISRFINWREYWNWVSLLHISLSQNADMRAYRFGFAAPTIQIFKCDLYEGATFLPTFLSKRPFIEGHDVLRHWLTDWKMRYLPLFFLLTRPTGSSRHSSTRLRLGPSLFDPIFCIKVTNF